MAVREGKILPLDGNSQMIELVIKIERHVVKKLVFQLFEAGVINLKCRPNSHAPSWRTSNRSGRYSNEMHSVTLKTSNAALTAPASIRVNDLYIFSPAVS
jgi:hypothetical protein